METLVEQARKRAQIRRSIPRGEPDRISDLLEALADRIEELENESKRWYAELTSKKACTTP